MTAVELERIARDVVPQVGTTAWRIADTGAAADGATIWAVVPIIGGRLDGRPVFRGGRRAARRMYDILTGRTSTSRRPRADASSERTPGGASTRLCAGCDLPLPADARANRTTHDGACRIRAARRRAAEGAGRADADSGTADVTVSGGSHDPARRRSEHRATGICTVCGGVTARRASTRHLTCFARTRTAHQLQTLMDRVDRSDPDACWPWPGHLDPEGYAKFGDRRVARLILADTLGRALAPNENACHHCDNPPCVNPSHLFAGSQSENLLDMVAKDRQPAQMRPRTHCHRGHPLVGDNVSVEGRHRARRCRTCKRINRLPDQPVRPTRAPNIAQQRALDPDRLIGAPVPPVGAPTSTAPVPARLAGEGAQLRLPLAAAT